MKTALVTLCIPQGNNAAWMDAGLPSKRAHAQHIGAEFVNITQAKLGGAVASEKYQIGDMLANFDRIIYMDADMFVVPDAPSLFDVVPEDHFGIFDESQSVIGPRTALLAWLKQGWPDCPCEFYANNGLFVCSREHRWLFDHKTLNTKLGYAYEQTHMTHRIWEALWHNPPQIKVHWLAKNWNWMPRTWVGDESSPTGWVSEPQPDPCWIHHFPCHRPEERLAAITALNKKHGLKT